MAENLHHKLVLSLRIESLHSRSPSKNQKLSLKILYNSVDGPKKANCHSQWRHD